MLQLFLKASSAAICIKGRFCSEFRFHTENRQLQNKSKENYSSILPQKKNLVTPRHAEKKNPHWASCKNTLHETKENF